LPAQRNRSPRARRLKQHSNRVAAAVRAAVAVAPNSEM
jgi:hypothetical protein